MTEYENQFTVLLNSPGDRVREPVDRASEVSLLQLPQVTEYENQLTVLLNDLKAFRRKIFSTKVPTSTNKLRSEPCIILLPLPQVTEYENQLTVLLNDLKAVERKGHGDVDERTKSSSELARKFLCQYPSELKKWNEELDVGSTRTSWT